MFIMQSFPLAEGEKYYPFTLNGLDWNLQSGLHNFLSKIWGKGEWGIHSLTSYWIMRSSCSASIPVTVWNEAACQPPHSSAPTSVIRDDKSAKISLLWSSEANSLVCTLLWFLCEHCQNGCILPQTLQELATVKGMDFLSPKMLLILMLMSVV